MKRFAIRIAALLLTFFIGTSVAYFFHKLCIQFDAFAVGQVIIKPDGYGGFTSYKSYDGVNLNFLHFDFPSHEAANEAFQNTLSEAIKIIEREPLYDRKRENIVGERVVAIFPPSDYLQTEWASVICLDDTKLYRISSPSLRHALVFDKTARRY